MLTQNRKKTEITLLTGKIGLYKYTNQSQMADRILLPGERAVFLKSDNKLSISTVHPENTISWVTGILNLKTVH